jgi:transcriptional regulator with XRE-family HTH domain
MQRSDRTKLTKLIGKRLSEHREKLGLSQSDFADKVGISRGYLSDLERGVREMSLETLTLLCRKGGTSPDNLLGFR